MPSKSRRSKGNSSKSLSSTSKSRNSAKTLLGSQDAGSRCSTPISSTSSTPGARTSTRIRTKKLLKSVKKRPDSDSEKDYGDEYMSHTDSDPDESFDRPDEELEADGIPTLEQDDDEWTETSSVATARLSFRPPTPEILDDDEIPTLELPESSNDLSISGQEAFVALGVYEILRHFRVLLRLSPFRFEDFCCALTCDENSSLISQIHIGLLKALLREEEANQTWFGPPDSKDSVNVVFHFLDAMTWYECVRIYLSGDKSKEFQSALPALSKTDYFSTSLNERLTILQTLANLYLSSNAVREELLKEGQFTHEDHCRNCHK